jgi:type IV secretion system protein VirD4
LQYITSALGLLSRLSLFVVFTPILAAWFFVWMVIATGFAMFAWLILIIILSDVPMGEALWHWVLFWPMLIAGWIAGANDWSNRTGIRLWGRRPSDSHGSARFATRKERAAFEGGDGLLIGRDLDTGKLLRYDGPAHLLTLAPPGRAKVSAR